MKRLAPVWTVCALVLLFLGVVTVDRPMVAQEATDPTVTTLQTQAAGLKTMVAPQVENVVGTLLAEVHDFRTAQEPEETEEPIGIVASPGPLGVSAATQPEAMLGGGPNRSGEQPGPGPAGDPGRYWETRLGYISPRVVGPVSSPAVHSGLVYVGDFLGSLWALDMHTGAVKWRFDAPAPNILSSPAVPDDVVFFAVDGNKSLYALDAATGEELWTFPSGGLTSPAVAYGVVYFGGTREREDSWFDTNLHAVDAVTGAELWRFPALAVGTPAFADGIVYFLGNTGEEWSVFAVDAANGQEHWRAPVDDPCADRARNALSVASGRVYVVPCSRVLVFDASSGADLGSLPYSSSYASRVVAAGDHLYLIDQSDALIALNHEFQELWRTEPMGCCLGWISATTDTVYTMQVNGSSIFAFDASTGAPQWNLALPAISSVSVGCNIDSDPAIVDGVIYQLCIDSNYDGVVLAVGGTSSLPVVTPPPDIEIGSVLVVVWGGGAELYGAPSTDSLFLGMIAPGTELVVTGPPQEGSWWPVEVDGMTGYVDVAATEVEVKD
jgi:outer membrane protein assembly factor BamB